MHHSALLQCNNADPDKLEKYVNKPTFSCYDILQVPEELRSCLDTTKLATMPNKETPFTYTPLEAGIPLGKDPENVYVLSQVHLMNHGMKVKGTLKSIWRVYYTEQLRKYDLGHFYTGAVLNTFILPPKVPRVKIQTKNNFVFSFIFQLYLSKFEF